MWTLDLGKVGVGGGWIESTTVVDTAKEEGNSTFERKLCSEQLLFIKPM